MRPTIWRLILPLLALSCVAGCKWKIPAPADDALFRDVSRRPPDAAPATIEALTADPAFGAWVVYQDRACDRWGCAQ
ncbi:hypothetical protein [Sagittula sp. S175]|uniref:hypothetical protein n=1 Tax=Sagittula sp. S175 TaxID=3415129 RepID=UPI003C7B10B6